MTQIAGYAAIAGFAWLALFQIALAFGLPFGRLAWGGAHRVLPGRLRAASFASAAVALVGLAVVAQAAGRGPELVPLAVLGPLLWALTALLALSVLANLLGARGLERLHGVPLALVLAVSCGALAAAI